MFELPFTAEQFFGVFASYNDAVWPAQLVLGLIAAAIALATWIDPRVGNRVAPVFLAVLWIWSGVAYHLLEFTRVNPAAFLFAGLFVLQGLLFLWAGREKRIRFDGAPGSWRWIGVGGIGYALVIYPIIGLVLGEGYPAAPTFGAPCPSTIFTFGLLLWARPPVPIRLLVIPTLWAVLTAPMAIGWGVWQDAAMPLIALIGAFHALRANRAARSARATLADMTPAPS
jgi:hypothetical protein